MVKVKIIKAVDGQQANVVILGLEEGNIELLKQGKPIPVDLAELGLSGQILITYGKTKADIFKDLQRAGIFLGGSAN